MDVLFHLGEAAGPDLDRSQLALKQSEKGFDRRTIAMSSYSMSGSTFDA
jgi:hypothetical protein